MELCQARWPDLGQEAGGPGVTAGRGGRSPEDKAAAVCTVLCRLTLGRARLPPAFLSAPRFPEAPRITPARSCAGTVAP